VPDPTRPYEDRGWGGPGDRQPRPWYDGPPPPARPPAPEPWDAWPPPAPAAPVAPSAPATRPLVEVEHLTKVYEPSPPWMKVLLRSSISEPVTAVSDLSLEVWPGQVFAVVGPNGAGKSTLFRVLTGLITPTSGRVALAGIDVVGDARSARRHIGFMPAEDRSLNLRHTCWQNLAFHGRLQGIPRDKLGPRIDDVLETVGLGHVPDRTGHALSSGMRARLQLARALLHEPAILVLDEPTGTIDPVGAHDLLQLIQRLAADRQLAVLLSSHRLEEIDALEDNVLFINKGEVVHTGSMDSLRDVMEQPILRLRFDSPASARQACDHLSAGRDLQVSVDGDELHVAGNPTPGDVLSRLGSHLARVEAVDRSRIPLQELITRLVRGGAPKPATAPTGRPSGGPPPSRPLPRRTPPAAPAATNGTPSWRGASWRPSGPPAPPGGRANGAPNRTPNGATNRATANGEAQRGRSANGSSADGTWDNGASGYGSWGNGSSGNGSWGNGSSGNGSWGNGSSGNGSGHW
jgi:ABC-2 type transport system ATP-binding protein